MARSGGLAARLAGSAVLVAAVIGVAGCGIGPAASPGLVAAPECPVTGESLEGALGQRVRGTLDGDMCRYSKDGTEERVLLIEQRTATGSDADELVDRSGCVASGKLDRTGSLADLGALSDYCVWREDGRILVDMTLFAGARVWGVSLTGLPPGTGAADALSVAMRIAAVVSARATELAADR